MTKDEALKLALEALENLMYWDNGKPEYHEANKAITAIKEALAQQDVRNEIDCGAKTLRETYLAQPEREPVAAAWDKGYQQGVQDERTSEANIGIAGFGAKVQPARQNPYGTTSPPVSGTHKQEPVAYQDTADKCRLETVPAKGGLLPQRTWVGLTPQERDEINKQVYGAVPHHVAFHHAIEAKLKEKNGIKGNT